MAGFDPSYPTNAELLKLKKWDIFKKSQLELLDFIESIWWASDWGYKLKGKRVLRLELHTGGWSGNESIIEALQENFIFWSMSWEKTLAGGHYYFRIRLLYGEER